MQEKTLTLTNVYDGQKMRLFGWSKPVVIDVSGLYIPNQVCPLLKMDDDSETAVRVGAFLTIADGGSVWMKIEGGDKNFYSIGAEVEAAELIESGERKINGHTIQAPFYHVTKSVLREVMECDNAPELRIASKESLAEAYMSDIKKLLDERYDPSACGIGPERFLSQIEGLVYSYETMCFMRNACHSPCVAPS